MEYRFKLTAITADGISGIPEYKSVYKVTAATERELAVKLDKIKRKFALKYGVGLDMIKIQSRKVEG